MAKSNSMAMAGASVDNEVENEAENETDTEVNVNVNVPVTVTATGGEGSGAAADVDDGGEKVTLCHEGQTIEVAPAAVAAHLAHGDTLGPCPEPVVDVTEVEK